ncbi:MAG: VWA domain-containing protein, partial [Propionibacteriaceae bacterium]|nr:VWA domain-containing protein [Propionibacteriaceae bacterium]
MNERGRRWRLILGRYAEDRLRGPGGRGGLAGADGDLDRVLGFLYDREYAERGHRLADRGGARGGGRGGGRDSSTLTAVNWLARARALFPASTFERLQTEAITRYGVTDLLADPGTAAAIPPSPELGAALLSLRGRLDEKLEEGLRIVIAKVVEDIVARLKTTFTAALMGRRDRFRRSVQPSAANFDARATIRANLAHYDTESRRLLIDRARFVSRVRRRLTWDVVLCVDQSASMADSVLHSAVVASILAGLPGVNVRLVLFDTSVVDLSHLARDPVGVLMTAQLGGGTDIAAALAYAETLVATPKRTVLALISDFEEGGSIPALLASVSRLREAGVTLLGVA